MTRAEVEQLLEALHWPWDRGLSTLLDWALVLEGASSS
jgi:hypothetical protein